MGGIMVRLKLSPAGVAFLRAWEGSRSRAYLDQARKMTIGVGHLLLPAELRAKAVRIGDEWVPYGMGFTTAQIDALLAQDVREFEDAVNERFARRGLKQPEFDALVTVAFNIGIAAFAGATFVARLANGDRDAAFEAWGWYNKITVVQGSKRARVVSQGLVKRRAAEIGLFRDGDYAARP